MELNQRFDNVINRLPDLCMPPSYRLAGENDYFDCTKDIKLIPFKKQRIFETCINRELASSSNPKLLHRLNGESRRAITPDAKLHQPLMIGNRNQFSLHSSINDLSKIKHSSTSGSQFSNAGKLSREQVERNRKLKLREMIKQRYSNLKVVRRIDGKKIDKKIGYNRLFIRVPSADYPYSNPMPDCMITKDNIDNLREIIVSAIDIEWKMLTPVRPPNEYEEKYFDRLIQLHRCRYKSRLEAGYFTANQIVPFKHIRHTFLVQYENCNTLATTSFEAKSRRQSRAGSRLKTSMTNIPVLTLTSDDILNERLVHSDDETIRDDVFDYEEYSRFSKQNLRNAISPNAKVHSDDGSRDIMSAIEQQQNLDGPELLEDRVEKILSQLVNINISDC